MLELHTTGIKKSTFYCESGSKDSHVLDGVKGKIRAIGIRSWYIQHPVAAVTVTTTLLMACFFVSREFSTSRLQAEYFSRTAAQLTYAVDQGKSDAIRFPNQGPHDIRLGYTRLPAIINKLTSKPYDMQIARQARMSPTMVNLIDKGVFATYHEKIQAGLEILDKDKRSIFRETFPQRIYKSYEEIPPLILQTLLFIENRELLNQNYPYKNPAIEWDRFTKAIGELIMRKIFGGARSPGGSTIATQLEKYRHSAEGRTQKPIEKIEQMYSATLRAYLDGPETLAVRKKIILDYINSIPLAAVPRYGELNGLGDGLWGWFNADFNQINQVLRNNRELPGKEIQRKAQAYVQVLGLFLAHRRPSAYLIGSRQALKQLTARYLRILYRHGVISRELRDEALKLTLPFRSSRLDIAPVSFLDRKAANLIRTSLLSDFDMQRLYELDRFDLTVSSSINSKAQDLITDALRKLKDEKSARAAGLFADRIFQAGKRLDKVMYSFTLYERGEHANYLRIETDNLDQPFNINHGVKLDLGSTAKLRTLVTYLQVVAARYEDWATLPAQKLAAVTPHHADRISIWVRDYLAANAGASLTQVLEASMGRTYSANPGERFFTGGGLHTFNNFKKEDNGRTMDVWEATRQSVNLVYIRMMRDIANYYTYRDAENIGRILDDKDDESRKTYLARFADKEGSQFLNSFFQKYRNLNRAEILDTLFNKVRLTTVRYAAVLRSLDPNQSLKDFSEFMLQRFPEANLDQNSLTQLYNRYAFALSNLADRGYIARIHPLEIWLASYLIQNPKASRADMLRDSAAARQEVYGWLIKSRHKSAQDSRIRIMLESEAFQKIHKEWKKVGYPFDFLIPSLATSIGSSADKPAALAELMGILVNDGIRLPTVKVSSLHFAKDTPFETLLTDQPRESERVLPAEVAQVTRKAILGVVENGTARRVYQAFKDAQGTVIPVGGKTGTGDHRYETYGAGGRLLSSRVVNRTATFAFFIGERYFGTLTAFVPGEDAAAFKFTSALPVQLLKYLSPVLLENAIDYKVEQAPQKAAIPSGTPATGPTKPKA